MKLSACMTSKGQITIPQEIRTRLGLKKGDRVAFEIKDGVATLSPERNKENPFAAYSGILKAFDSVEDINAWVADMRETD